MKAKILTSLFIVSLLCFSCQKETNPGIDVFPDNIGDEWTYKIIDNNSIVKVQVVGQGQLPNGVDAKIWKYSYSLPNYTDSLWVTYINSDIRFYYKPCWTCPNPMPEEYLHFIMPLSVGDSWHTNAPYGDTTKVLKKVNLTEPVGFITNVYCISKFRGPVTNSWTFDTIYFKENVGIVKFNQHEFSLGPSIGNGTWELIQYNLK
ncbi:MAG TPA: hypothetical protein VIH57_06420 [Bacteroidales bacterium]